MVQTLTQKGVQVQTVEGFSDLKIRIIDSIVIRGQVSPFPVGLSTKTAIRN